MKELIGRLKNVKGLWAAVILFALGVLLLALPRGAAPADTAAGFDCAAYVAETEEKLTGMIKAICGPCDVRVMITPDSTPEQLYERDRKTRSSSGETVEEEFKTVYEDKRPVPVKQRFPEIRGVAVVCGAAADSAVREKIINTVSCALGVPAHRVYVTF